MNAKVKAALVAVVVERWERELMALGLDQGRAAREAAKLTDDQLRWAAKNGA